MLKRSRVGKEICRKEWIDKRKIRKNLVMKEKKKISLKKFFPPKEFCKNFKKVTIHGARFGEYGGWEKIRCWCFCSVAAFNSSCPEFIVSLFGKNIKSLSNPIRHRAWLLWTKTSFWNGCKNSFRSPQELIRSKLLQMIQFSSIIVSFFKDVSSSCFCKVRAKRKRDWHI